MSIRLVSVDSLMLHDAVLIESDLSSLSGSDWQSLIPSGRSLERVKSELELGASVVLSDTPTAPLFAMEQGMPLARTDYGSDISPQTLALLSRRFDSAGSSSLYHANNKGNLHPAPPLHYIADTSRIREAQSPPKAGLISDNFAKAPPKLELELCYDDSEKTYASNVPYSVIFSDPAKTVIKGVLNDKGWAMVEGGPNYPAHVLFGDEAEKAQAESALETQYKQLDNALNETAKQVASQITQDAAKAEQSRRIEVTAGFKAAVDKKIATLNAQSKDFDNLSYLSQSWALANSAKVGVSSGVSEYLPDLGEFGELIEAADIDISILIEAISTGNINALEAKLKQWNARGGQGFKEANKTMETLILLLSDPISREMLASVPTRILAALPEDKMAELVAYQATQMGMDTAVVSGGAAVGTLAGGVGGPVAAGILFAATTARKGGKALEGTINIVTDLSKSLKKINNQHEAKPYKKENELPLKTQDSTITTTPNLNLRKQDKNDSSINAHPALVRMKPYKAPCFEPGKQLKKNFKADPKKLEQHYARQLQHQQNGLNDLTIGEYLDNRQRYKDMKRQGTGMAQADFRADFNKKLKDSLYLSYENKMSTSAAKKLSAKRANEIMADLAALHDPDMVAGGNDSVNRMGDKRVNSSIGPQWNKKSQALEGKSRVQLMDEQVEAAAKRHGTDAKLNIQLERCSVRK